MMSDFNQPVDIYCERLNPSFWAEPLNALTNTAFILAGLFALGLMRRQKLRDWQLTTLGILTIIVGIGSFIFHTVATKGAILADTIPIMLFILFAEFVIFKRIFGATTLISIVCVIIFVILNQLTTKILGRSLFNGSIMYAPSLIILIITAAYSAIKKQPASGYFLISAGAFFISMICRSIDQQICPHFPLGSHFMWHILNAVTMYYVIYGLIKQKQKI